MTRITSEQKTKLWKFFDDNGFKRGTRFPKENGNKKLDEFLKEISLDKLGTDYRKKASRQLFNWKKARFEYAGSTFNFTEEQAYALVCSHMQGVNYNIFVRGIIDRMLKNNEDGDSHYKNYAFYVGIKGEIGRKLLKFILSQNELVEFFVNLIKYYERSLAKLLPNQLKVKNQNNLKFLEKKQKDIGKGGRLRISFKESLYKIEGWSTVLPSCEETALKAEFQALFCEMESWVFNSWKIKCFTSQLCDIEVPEEESVTESSKSVVAYIGGWILSCLKNKRGFNKPPMRENKKQSGDLLVDLSLVDDFFHSNSLSANQAKREGLPVNYIETRMKKKGKSHYPAIEFFKFLCRIETVYMKNYNLKMLVSYADGSLLEKISSVLKTNDGIGSQFAALCPSTIRFDGDKSLGKKILLYVLQKYHHMRVASFGKSHKGWRAKAEDRIEKGSLRTRVCSKAMVSKADTKLPTKTAGEAGTTADNTTDPLLESDEDNDGEVGGEEEEDEDEDLGSLDFEEAIQKETDRGYDAVLDAAIFRSENESDDEDEDEESPAVNEGHALAGNESEEDNESENEPEKVGEMDEGTGDLDFPQTN